VAVLVIATAVLWIGVFGAELGPAAVDAGRTIATSALWPALWHGGVVLYGHILSLLPRRMRQNSERNRGVARVGL